MAEKKLYKTTFSFTVLSDEPLSKSMSLTDIDDETHGDEGVSVISKIKRETTELVGKDAVKASYEFGMDPEWFFMDEDGNETPYE